MISNDYIIEVKNLTKKFGDVTALKNISFKVKKGEFVAVIGRSGSGKSTLLKCISGFLRPNQGSVIINNYDINNFSSKECCLFRNKEIGFVFQTFALDMKFTAYENIEIPLVISGVKSSKRRDRIIKVAEYVGIDKILYKKTEGLSGGEKQRIAVARAIINDPKILFADEPCGNLDKQNGDIILNLFEKLVKKGVTIVMVTHHEEDAKRADRIIKLLDGEII